MPPFYGQVIAASYGSVKSGIIAIYFILSGDTAVKIGYTTNLDLRLSTLQSSNPEELKTYRVVNGSMLKERRLHRIFKHQHIRGEWFRWCDEIREAIDKL